MATLARRALAISRPRGTSPILAGICRLRPTGLSSPIQNRLSRILLATGRVWPTYQGRSPYSGAMDLESAQPQMKMTPSCEAFAMLEMKTTCQSCAQTLTPTGEAYICSFECTFCPSCTAKANNTCPNCSGELVRRPKRVPA